MSLSEPPPVAQQRMQSARVRAREIVRVCVSAGCGVVLTVESRDVELRGAHVVHGAVHLLLRVERRHVGDFGAQRWVGGVLER